MLLVQSMPASAFCTVWPCAQEEIEAMIEEIDADGSGDIDFNGAACTKEAVDTSK